MATSDVEGKVETPVTERENSSLSTPALLGLDASCEIVRGPNPAISAVSIFSEN